LPVARGAFHSHHLQNCQEKNRPDEEKFRWQNRASVHKSVESLRKNLLLHRNWTYAQLWIIFPVIAFVRTKKIASSAVFLALL
jgi:hypothetical protein